MGILDRIRQTDTAAAPAVKVKPAVPSADQFIIIRPVVTEKSTSANSLNQYVFSVVREANKIAIAKAVEKQFGVKPVSVNVSWVHTKKRTRGRIIGKTKAWKKAVVTLPEGKTIAAAEAK